MDMPLPPGFKVVKPPSETRLTDQETLFICKKYLTTKQFKDEKVLAFITSYLECRNASQAARESGGNGNWRRVPEIHACIEAITAKAVMKYGYDAAEMIERMKEIANFDPIEFENPDGTFKTSLQQIRPEARRAIKKLKVRNEWGTDANGMKIVTGQIIDIEVWEKPKSIQLLGQEKGVLKETKVHTHDITERMDHYLLESTNRAEQRMKEVGPMAGRPLLEGKSDGKGAQTQHGQSAGDGQGVDPEVVFKRVED